ncbi:voltage-dependent anion channel-domain-containing protein [Schizophyllum fasciatum]
MPGASESRENLTRPDGVQPPVSSLARRIHGWSWQAFPIGMGTGAVYVTLSGLKEHSDALTTVETVFFFLNIILFTLNCTTLLIQAIIYPRQALRLIKDPVKGIFVPLVVLSFATIIIGTINYAVPSGHVHPGFIYALFWVYITFALVTCIPMLMIWYNQPHDLTHFTPAYAFLVFPMMLVGVVAFNVLNVMDPTDPASIGVLLVGYFFQGLGFFMTFFYICIYIIRLHAHNLVSPMAGEIWYATSVMSALLLYGLAVFLFFFGILPYWFKLHKHLNEILGCWALTFPNVGWISTTRVLGDIFHVQGLFVVHLFMTVVMCIAWAVLFSLTLLALWKGLIFCSKPEDVVKDTVAAHAHALGEKHARLGSQDAEHPHAQTQMQYAGEVPPMLYAGAAQGGQMYGGQQQQQQYGHGMV